MKGKAKIRYLRKAVGLARPVVSLIEIGVASKNFICELLLIFGELGVGLASLYMSYDIVNSTDSSRDQQGLRATEGGDTQKRERLTLKSIGMPVLPIFSISSG